MDFSGYYQRKQKNKTGKLLLFFVTAVLLVVCTFILSGTVKRPDQSTLGAKTTIAATPTFPPTVTDTPVVDNTKLTASVESALAGSKGKYGIVIKNFKTGEMYFSNEHEVFEPASLYKLWVMAVVFNKISAGELRRDQVLSQDVAVLNKKFAIASESAELTDGTITQTVADSLFKMITISDNYSALLLTEKVGLSSLSEYLTQHGFSGSVVSGKSYSPKTTPYDIASFLEKLYQGQLANPEDTKEMIELLKQQRLNNKLPKYLPDNVVVAHKTGELDSFTHDAGVVYAPTGDYLIVILSESDNPDAAEERIAAISRNVYKYFNL